MAIKATAAPALAQGPRPISLALKIATFIVWLLVGLSTIYWLLAIRYSDPSAAPSGSFRTAEAAHSPVLQDKFDPLSNPLMLQKNLEQMPEATPANSAQNAAASNIDAPLASGSHYQLLGTLVESRAETPTQNSMETEAADASRYSGHQSTRVAVIAVDGGIAKPFALGAILDDGAKVIAITPKQVQIQTLSGKSITISLTQASPESAPPTPALPMPTALLPAR